MTRKRRTRLLSGLLLVCLLITSMVSDVNMLSVQAAGDNTSNAYGITVPTDIISWDFTSSSNAFAGKEIQSSGTEQTALIDNMYIDATEGKFSQRTTQQDAQIGRGTVLTIPVNGACTIKIKAYYGSEIVVSNATLSETDSSNGWPEYSYENTGSQGVVQLEFEGEDYLKYIKTIYGSASEEIPEEETKEDICLPTTVTNWDFTGEEVVSLKKGESALFENLFIDATAGKFEYRDGAKDVQAAKGAILYVPVNQSCNVVFTAHKSSKITVGEQELTPDGAESYTTFTYAYTDNTAGILEVQITGESYLKGIQLVENTVEDTDPVEPTPEESITLPSAYTYWVFDGSEGSITTTFQKNKGMVNNLYVDAENGKFAPRTDYKDAQVNAGTILYIPVNEACTLHINATAAGQFLVNEETEMTNENGVFTYAYTGTTPTVLKVSVTANTYVTSIRAGEEVVEETPQVDIASLLSIPTTITEWSVSQWAGANYQSGNTVKTGVVANTYIDASTQGAKFTARESDIQVNAGTRIYVPVNRACTITVKAQDTTGISVNGQALTGTGTTNPLSFTYEYTGAEGYVTVEITQNGYLYGITCNYPKSALDYVGTKNQIDVWDLGGLAESDTSKYNNHIEASDWDCVADLTWTTATNATTQVTTYAPMFVAAGSTSFGDLTVNYGKKDRVYAEGSENSYSNYKGMKAVTFADGYTTTGAYYANGSAGSTRRYIQIDQVEAGETIVAYMSGKAASTADAATASETIHFVYLGSDGVQDVTDTLTTSAAIYSFQAKYSGSYKIYVEDVNKMKPNFYRIKKIPEAVVSGNIDLGTTGITNYTLQFSNDETGEVTEADLNGTKFAAFLAPGSYTASLKGTVGYDISTATKRITVTDEDILQGKTISLGVESKETVTIEGTISGFAADYDISALGVTLLSEDTSRDDVAVTMTSATTYTAIIEKGYTYTPVLTGAADYEVTNTPSCSFTEPGTYPIAVKTRETYEVTGSFLGITPGTVTALSFVHQEDGYTYTGTLDSANNAYAVTLRDGTYTVNAEASGYRTNTTVTVNGAATTRDLFFVAEELAVGSVTWTSDIYVGYPQMQNNYTTIQSAVDACEAMGITEEAQRVTIHIAPGTYREQVVVNTPYISFVNDTKEEVLVTWYYGIGYYYYSAGSDGFYDAELAYNKTGKNIATKWGAAVYLQKGATGFSAINITFENSFNRYMTQEELADGVEVTADNEADSKITTERTADLDVTSKDATERACAMAIDATHTQFYNCSFLSSQDTLYTHQNTVGYFRSCKIEGNTDYIYGYGDYVFDSCELSFAGYSDTTQKGGYITAARGENVAYGYLFNNCTITGNDGSTSSLIASEGYLGRPWDAQAKVTFLNTTVEREGLIKAVGWRDMNTTAAINANYHEYGSVYSDGTSVNTDKRIEGTLYTEEEAAAVSVTAYFGDWMPSFYSAIPQTPTPGAATPEGNLPKEPELQNPGDELPTPDLKEEEKNAGNEESQITNENVEETQEDSTTAQENKTSKKKNQQKQTAKKSTKKTETLQAKQSTKTNSSLENTVNETEISETDTSSAEQEAERTLDLTTEEEIKEETQEESVEETTEETTLGEEEKETPTIDVTSSATKGGVPFMGVMAGVMAGIAVAALLIFKRKRNK